MGMEIMVVPIMTTTALIARTTTTTPVSGRTTTTTAHITGVYTVMAITAMVFTITTGSAIILPDAVLEAEAAWAGFMVDSAEAEASPMAVGATEEEGGTAGEATVDRPIAVC